MEDIELKGSINGRGVSTCGKMEKLFVSREIMGIWGLSPGTILSSYTQKSLGALLFKIKFKLQSSLISMQGRKVIFQLVLLEVLRAFTPIHKFLQKKEEASKQVRLKFEVFLRRGYKAAF